MGKAGDSYEQHADSVADAVVAGRSAESILDKMAGSSTSAAAATQKKSSPIQYYRGGGSKPTDKGVRGWRIGEHEEVAVSQETGEGGYQLYAAASKIASGNAALTAAQSGIMLMAGTNTVTVGGKELVEISPTLNPAVTTPEDTKLKDVNAGTMEADDGSKTSDKLGLWADCGRASRGRQLPKRRRRCSNGKISQSGHLFKRNLFQIHARVRRRSQKRTVSGRRCSL